MGFMEASFDPRDTMKCLICFHFRNSKIRPFPDEAQLDIKTNDYS
jgi:hypothetical protein